MEAIKYSVMNAQGKEVGTVDLDPRVFGAPTLKVLVHDTVVWQRNKRRAGTHSTIRKGLMRGGGRKPWRQKGTGRARAGSNTSPLWVGGAVAHGPKPRDYSTRVPKRTRRQALVSVLSDKVRQKRLVVLDALEVKSGKTKDMQALLEKVGATTSSAMVLFSGAETAAKNQKTMQATRNLAEVLPVTIPGMNVFDLLKQEYLVCSTAGVQELQSAVLDRSGLGKKEKA